MKSRIVSVFWPVWMWLKKPSFRWLSYSYSSDLATQHALDSRRVIESAWFQSLWPELHLTGDQNTKSHYENNKGGSRRAGSMRAGITGFGGDGLLMDDPHDASGAESDAQRNDTLESYRLGVSTRLNDPREGFIVLVMQRLHEQDLAGYLDEEEPGAWETLCFPAEFDGEVRSTSLGAYDWRKGEGERLWEARYGEKELGDLKRSLQGYGEAGQLQQRPVSKAGGLFAGALWQYVDKAPPTMKVRAWDFAGTQGGGAFSAGVLLGEDEQGRLYLEDVHRGQWDGFGVEIELKSTAQRDGMGIPVCIPEDPGQAGKSQALTFSVRLLRGYDVRTRNPRVDKEIRARPFANQAKAGNVYLVRGAWNKPFIDEARMFPRGKYKDQIDAAADALAELVEHGGGSGEGLTKEDFAKVSGRALPKTGDEALLGSVTRRGKPRSGGGMRWRKG